jgi:hypothetical protein
MDMTGHQSTLTGEPKTELVNVSRYGKDGVQMIDRDTKFGNKFRLKEDGGNYTRQESVEKYREWFKNKIQSKSDFREDVEDLRGETLGCWCKPKDCHGDVILEYLRGRMDINESDN